MADITSYSRDIYIYLLQSNIDRKELIFNLCARLIPRLTHNIIIAVLFR
jgi:hypothetical protein